MRCPLEGWNYLTCYKESEISFKFYTDPFQLEVWFCIAITVTIFSILTDVFVAKKLKKIQPLSSLFFYFGAFLEESSSLPSDLLNHSAFRVGVGPWILLSSILSNVYVSLILRGLNSPPPPTHFDTWEALLPPNSSRNESKDLVVWHRMVSRSRPDRNSMYFEDLASSQQLDTRHKLYLSLKDGTVCIPLCRIGLCIKEAKNYSLPTRTSCFYHWKTLNSDGFRKVWLKLGKEEQKATTITSSLQLKRS